MQPVITYLLKMVLCSAILLGYYWLALRNERFHQWNRFYLLSAFVLSIAVPFLKIPLLLEEEPAVVVNMVASLPWNMLPSAAPAFIWTWKTTLILAALLVSMAMLLHMVVSVVKVIRIYRSSDSTYFNDVRVVVTEEASAPFSFFKWLFWRQDIDPDSENGRRMLKHELTHIREKHSADKLFTELLLINFWMNPFFWIMRHELYAIHEFRADQEAIARNDGAAFAAMILQATHASSAPTLSNPFFTSQLKRRLIMITTSHAPSYSYLRRISGLVLMLLTTTLLVLSIEQAQAQKKASPPPPTLPPPVKEVTELPDSIKSVEVIEAKGVSYFKYEMKDGRRLMYNLDEARKKNFYIPPPPPPTPVPPVPAVPPAPPAPANIPRAPAVQNSKSPAVALQELTGDPQKATPLYIYAGLEITEAQMKQIDPATIESINVLKGEHAVKAYGDKGKDGVVLITPKAKNVNQNANKDNIVSPNKIVSIRSTNQVNAKNESANTVNIRSNENGGVSPVYMINKQKVGVEQVNVLDANVITTVNVLKKEQAIKKYGADGTNGVVEITTSDKPVTVSQKLK